MGEQPVVAVRALSVFLGSRPLVENLSFNLYAGRTTALLGASGSGKTTTALALLGEVPAGAILSGEVDVAGRATVGAESSPANREAVRGRAIAYLPQDPASTLNPARRIGKVLAELAALHHAVPRRGANEIVAEVLDSLDMSATRSVLRRFPHEFSGGQRQRIALAQVLVCGARVVVLDEPTVGLDRATKAQVVRELSSLTRRNMSILLLSHDTDVVDALADEITHLPTASPSGTQHGNFPATDAVAVGPTVLRARDLRLEHRTNGGRETVVRGFDLDLAAGECVGLAGASGAGKTTIGRCIAGLHSPASGTVTFDGVELGPLARRDHEVRRRIQYVWQDVRSTFFDRRAVLEQVAHTAVRLRAMSVDAAQAEAVEMLKRLGVTETVVRRRSANISGGELQRAALVRALIAHPDLLVCDEVTTALDRPVERAVLDLLTERQSAGMALLLISHDNTLLAESAHRIRTLD